MPSSRLLCLPKTHNNNIESTIEHANDFSWSDNRTKLLCQIMDQIAEVEMGRLFLGKLGGVY